MRAPWKWFLVYRFRVCFSPQDDPVYSGQWREWSHPRREVVWENPAEWQRRIDALNLAAWRRDLSTGRAIRHETQVLFACRVAPWTRGYDDEGELVYRPEHEEGA